MCAEDVGCGLLERSEFEGETAGPDEGCAHWGADLVVGEDAVFVGLAAGAVAGVEVVGDLARPRGCGCWTGALD